MTPEAALAKLSYLLAIEGLTVDDKRRMLRMNLRGELTQPDMKRLSLSDNNFLTTVAASLRVSSNTEMDQIKQSLFPSLMCSAAKLGDLDTLAKLRREGGDYSVEDVSIILVSKKLTVKFKIYLMDNNINLRIIT